jgi:hypothetical protein
MDFLELALGNRRSERPRPFPVARNDLRYLSKLVARLTEIVKHRRQVGVTNPGNEYSAVGHWAIILFMVAQEIIYLLCRPKEIWAAGGFSDARLNCVGSVS